VRILFLSRWFPEPADNGAKIRIWNVLRQLAVEHEISLVSFRDRNNDRRPGELNQICRHVVDVPYRPFQPTSASALLGLLASEPRFLVDTWSQPMAEAVADELARWAPDVVVASQLDMLPYALRLPRVPRLLEELELSTYLDSVAPGQPWHRRARAQMTWLKLQAYLRQHLPRFAACTVVSERERQNVQHAAPSVARSVRVVPNCLDLADYAGHQQQPAPNTLIYSGALTYAANFDAVRYFVDEILGELKREAPDVLLRVTGDLGKIDPATLPRDQAVRYTGYLDDVRPAVAQSWTLVVPLRQGGGTRLKVLEAMALGTPVVSTSKGVEGLAVTDGENALIADDPRSFARRVGELLRSPEQRQRLARGGRRLVEERYNWRVVGRDLRALVNQVRAA
jgi:glycosyltransferase involved in cell wall biosynthesis